MIGGQRATAQLVNIPPYDTVNSSPLPPDYGVYGSVVAPNDTGEGSVVAPHSPLTRAGRWIVDRTGRVLIIHGVNVPSKWYPFYTTAFGFNDAHGSLIATAGFNAVRLTVERYAVATAPGVFNDAYLSQVAATAAMLANHGILTMIDLHQDDYGPVFNDNGYPAWMTMTDGLPNSNTLPYPQQLFFNAALLRAFDHLWANDIGPSGNPLQVDDAGIAAHITNYLANQSGLRLLGYEVLNEPWPGSQYPSYLGSSGNYSFDVGPVSAYYARMVPAIRGVDSRRMIWYEPIATFNIGTASYVIPPADSHLGFAFHDYPVLGNDQSPAINNALSYTSWAGTALLATEFGATTDTNSVRQELDQYDQNLMPWMFWSYTRYVAAYEADGVTLAPPGPSTVNAPMLYTLSRPYPQLVAGTPLYWNYDQQTRTFGFLYSTSRADGTGSFGDGSQTTIAVPVYHYPTGYVVATGGAVVDSAPNAPILVVHSVNGATTIAVVITPAP